MLRERDEGGAKQRGERDRFERLESTNFVQDVRDSCGCVWSRGFLWGKEIINAQLSSFLYG